MAAPALPAPAARPPPRTQRDFTARYREAQGISFRAGLPHYRNAEAREGYNTSGSRLGVEALLAFRVLPMLDLPPQDVIPGYPVPDEEPKRPGFREIMLKYLRAASASQLEHVAVADLPADDPMLMYREELMKLEKRLSPESAAEVTPATTITPSSMTNFLNNPFCLVFTAIRDLRSRLLAEEFEDPYDGLTGKKSAEEDEDKAERGSEELLHRLMEVILLFFAQQTGVDWMRSTAAASSHHLNLIWDPTEQLPIPKRRGKASNPILQDQARDEIEEEEEEREEEDDDFLKEQPAAPRNTDAIEEEEEQREEEHDDFPEERNTDAIEEDAETIPGESTAPAPATSGPTQSPPKVPSAILQCTAADDGYLYLSRAGKTTGSNRWSNVPIVRYEAKRLDLSGFKLLKTAEERAKEKAAEKAKKKKAAAAAKKQMDTEETSDEDETSDSEIEEETSKDSVIMKPGDLTITAQQYAEMLTGIYINARYADDVEQKKLARKIEQQQYEPTRLESIEAAKAQKEAEKQQAEQLKLDQKRIANENAAKAREDSFMRKDLAAEEARAAKALGRRGGAGSKLTTAQKHFATNGGAAKVVAQKGSKEPTFVMKKIQKTRFTPKSNARGTKKMSIAKQKAEKIKGKAMRSKKILPYTDQEAFNIRMRHTYLSISHIETPAAYLTAVVTKPRLDSGPNEPVVEFRQTKEFNLLHPEDRYNAGKAIWALLTYLHYGKTKIGRLQGASKNALALYNTSGDAGSDTNTEEETEEDIKITVPEKRYPPRGIRNPFAASCYANSVIQGISAAISLRNLRTFVDPEILVEQEPSKISRTIFARFLEAITTLIRGPPDEAIDCKSVTADERMALGSLPPVLVVQLQRLRRFSVVKPPTASEPDNGVPPKTLQKIIRARKAYETAEKDWKANWTKKNPGVAITSPKWAQDFKAFKNKKGGSYIVAKNETPLDLFSSVQEPEKSFQVVQLSSFDGKQCFYELYAFICHKGDAQQGHYVAFVRHDEQTQDKRRTSSWYLCNDSERSKPLNLKDLVRSSPSIQREI
ncbi:hypothetical protein DXG03_007457 [Asterophora parasitica]|uniref:USP domain-containing protein n=1 Tax=Asterophora parasitica TaxID=117018 RepID=A0A9P7GCS2_9AGAR|nr:hypothetical protein DXG03_007457 [Asterophora parasitica]